MSRIQKNGKSPAIVNRKATLVCKTIVSALLNWFISEARDLPWRKTRDPYGIWVSEIMLQQTQVKTVIPYWERWMQELPDISSLANAPSEKIHKLWEGLGYYTRVRNMQKAAQLVVEKHGGQFPNQFEDILSLPGIGRYTAGAICSIAFNQPTPILDGNVIRVLTRVYGIPEDPREKPTNEQLWNLALDLVSHAVHLQNAQHAQSFEKDSDSSQAHIPACSFLNQSLMELGALICTPRQTQCSRCPIQNCCVAHRKNLVGKLPNLGERTAATHRQFVAFIVQQEKRFLVQQRPAGVVNAQLWEFPNAEVEDKNPLAGRAFAPFEIASNSEALCKIRHSITRYRILLEAYSATLNSTGDTIGNWFTIQELNSLPFSSAHRKILQFLQRNAD